MDIEVILGAAESEAPRLRALAWRFPKVEADQLGVALDLASAVARWADGMPGVHVTEAVNGLLGHLAARPDAHGD